MVMDNEMEELRSLLEFHLSKQGFQLEEDRILDSEMHWRPPLYATKGESKIAVDVRLNNTITEFWLKTYKQTYDKFPDIDIFVAIPEEISVPYVLGKKLEETNVGIIQVSHEGIVYLLEPRSVAERKATRAIRRKLDARIDKTEYQHLEPYVQEITDAVNIFEIGCPREAIGAIGRVLETAIDHFLIEANRKRKIPVSEERRKSMTFDNKIGFLASDTNTRTRRKPVLITPGEKSKMLSVKWDRNIGDHPAEEEQIKQVIQDSRAILELGINMIELMRRKKEEL